MKQRTKYKIALDPASPNPAVGQLMYDRTVACLMVFTGTHWAAIDSTIYYCVLCGGADWAHDQKENKHLDHPFCANNLELLEWKACDKI